jgi:HEAT repeat protein
MSFFQRLFGGTAAARVDRLIFKLKDPDPVVRTESVRKMIDLGMPAVGILIAYLEHDDKWARLMAAAALGKMDDLGAVGPLERHLQDPDEGVRLMARTALEELRRK